MNPAAWCESGRTVSVNPGSEYGEGILRGCLLTLTKDQVKQPPVDGRMTTPAVGRRDVSFTLPRDRREAVIEGGDL